VRAGGSAWRAERDRLVGLAYRMLGSVADAEEVVQEAFLRLHRSPGVADPAAWLTTVVSRLCLDHLGTARARREVSVGQWLPEPLLGQPDPQDGVALAESVSTALLVVLEALSPLERVVFVLHEAFGFDHPAIAAALCRSPAAVRQVATRARRHVQARRPRFDAGAAQRDRVARAFLAACAGGDLEWLLAVLDPEAVRCSRCWTPRRCCAPTSGKQDRALRPVPAA
jgi:RNA polymerase sigma-70 factor, ECF subfamily